MHRVIGAAAAIFVIFMVLTGLAINHSNGMGLDQRQLSTPFLFSWYGLEEPAQVDSFAVNNDWLSFAGSQLYLNDKAILTVSDGIGAVASGEMLVVAAREELLLLDLEGNLIERLPWAPDGAGSIESIGLLEESTVMVRTRDHLWLADADLVSWKIFEDSTKIPDWSFGESAPGLLRRTITQNYRGEGLSVEKLLLDFHSGRMFGPIGVIVYDLIALTVGFLAVSGLILWFRGRRNGKRNGKR